MLGSRLLTPQSTFAIILGAHDWTEAGLKRAPSFLHSGKGLLGYLIDSAGLGLDPSLVLDLFDDADSPDRQLRRIKNTLSVAISDRKADGNPITDVLVFYVGHGQTDDQGHLAFLIRCSTYGMEAESGIKAVDLARILRVSAPKQRRVIILDCCFSEAAANAFIGMSSLDQAVASVAASDLKDETATMGTLLLCSSPLGEVSWAPRDRKYTAFSGALLHILRNGIDDINNDLSLADLRDAAYSQMLIDFGANARRPVLHQVNAKHGDLTRISAFPNVAIRKMSEEAARRAAEQDRQEADEKNRQDAEIKAKRAAQRRDRRALMRAQRDVEAQLKAEAERAAEEAVRLALEQTHRVEEELRRKAEAEHAAEEAARLALEQARQAEEEFRRKAEAEAERAAEEAVRLALEQAHRAEEELHRKAEAEAKRAAEEAVRLALEQAHQVEGELRQKAEAEAERVAEEAVRFFVEEQHREIEKQFRPKANVPTDNGHFGNQDGAGRNRLATKLVAHFVDTWLQREGQVEPDLYGRTTTVSDMQVVGKGESLERIDKEDFESKESLVKTIGLASKVSDRLVEAWLQNEPTMHLAGKAIGSKNIATETAGKPLKQIKNQIRSSEKKLRRHNEVDLGIVFTYIRDVLEHKISYPMIFLFGLLFFTILYGIN